MPYADPNSDAAVASLRAARRRHYERNKDAYKRRAAERTAEMRQYVREIKASTPCADCRVQYPFYVMQFDHARGAKVASINLMAARGNQERLDAEIAKCDVVCANCHAVRTFKRAAEAKYLV